MPGGDGTGPMGMGKGAGRRAGACAGTGVPGFMNRGFGGGRGARGGGHRRRNMFNATGLAGWQRQAAGPAAVEPAAAEATQPTPRDQELELLKQQAEDAAATLQEIRQRIDELEQPAES